MNPAETTITLTKNYIKQKISNTFNFLQNDLWTLTDNAVAWRLVLYEWKV